MRRVQLGLTEARAALPSLLASSRGYHWPYASDMVPDGVSPSSFQASTVPSVRKNIIREYALGPLFGAQTPLCILGFFPPTTTEAGTHGATHRHLNHNHSDSSGRQLAAELIDAKRALRVALAELLSCDVKEVELGRIVLSKEMMLYRAGTPESPRLADGPGASGQYKERRVSRYARRPIAARAFMDVYVPDSIFESPEDKKNFAFFVQDRILNHAREANTFDATRAAAAAAPPPVVEASEAGKKAKISPHQREAFESDMEERARVLDSVSDLLDLGVVYCEVPVREEDVDGHDFAFTHLHGEELDLQTAEQVLDRWDRRLGGAPEAEEGEVGNKG